MGGTVNPNYLSREEEYDLIRRWKENQDKKAVETLLKAFEPMLKDLAHKGHQRHAHVQSDDFLQGIRETFIKALEPFDPSLGYRLSTFLRVRLGASVQTQSHMEAMKRVPKDAKSKLIRMTLLSEMAKHPELIWPTVSVFKAVSKKTKLSVERVEAYYERSLHVSSLDTPISEDSTMTFGDFVEDEKTIDPVNLITRKKITEVLNEGLSSLPERQEIILRERFGLAADDEIKTLGELSAVFQISIERVRQIEVQAKKNLLEFFERNGFEKDVIENIFSP